MATSQVSSTTAIPVPPGFIKVVIVQQEDRQQFSYTVRLTDRFDKPIKRYCHATARDINALRFMFDGQRVDFNSTFADHDIKEEESPIYIDMFIHQIGG